MELNKMVALTQDEIEEVLNGFKTEKGLHFIGTDVYKLVTNFEIVTDEYLIEKYGTSNLDELNLLQELALESSDGYSNVDVVIMLLKGEEDTYCSIHRELSTFGNRFIKKGIMLKLNSDSLEDLEHYADEQFNMESPVDIDTFNTFAINATMFKEEIEIYYVDNDLELAKVDCSINRFSSKSNFEIAKRDLVIKALSNTL